MDFRLKIKVIMSSSDSTIRQQGRHLTPEQIHDYQSTALPLDELVSIYRHLDECGPCRRTLRFEIGEIQIPAEALAIPEPLHLSYEELVAFMDQKADETAKEHAEAHLFLCSACSRELEGLERLEKQLSVEKPAEALVAPAKKTVNAVGLRERIARLFAVPGIEWQLGYGLVAIMAGILVLYRANMGVGAAAGASGAARVFAPISQTPSGLGLGGIVLVGGGVAYLLYLLFKKR